MNSYIIRRSRLRIAAAAAAAEGERFTHLRKMTIPSCMFEVITYIHADFCIVS